MSATGGPARPMLRYGSKGPPVSTLQSRLNAVSPSAFRRLAVDGIFGPRTLDRVREFQRQKGLRVDGIAGPHTWGALLTPPPVSVPPEGAPNCGTSDPGNYGVGKLVQNEFLGLRSSGKLGFAGSKPAPASLSAAGSSPIRMLTPAQESKARSIYGDSIDFSSVFLSNKSGIGNRPFTVAFPDSNQVVQIINFGTFTPRDRTLIHELGHVWQSQHHSDPYRFMVNSVDCQTGAAVSNADAALHDPGLVLHSVFPGFYPFSAYAYTPGFGIASYGAEQMAQAAENGEKTVVSEMRSKARNSVVADNITALSRPRFSDRRLSGVKR